MLKNAMLSFALLPLFAGVTIKGCKSKCPGDKCPGVMMDATQYVAHMTSMLSAQESRVDLPVDVRKKNYGPSCYHASTINCCVIAGYPEVAEEWPSKHGGPANTDRIVGILDKYNVRFAVCTNGDIKFLEWASRNRLACAIPYYSSHAINFMYFEDGTGDAMLLDNNRTKQYIRVPRDKFEHNWRYVYGGDAICVLPREGTDHTGPMPPMEPLVK